MTTVDPLWFKDAVFYELHVKAFCDSNDDGIGDFRGLTGKLDYLEWLGVTCIWGIATVCAHLCRGTLPGMRGFPRPTL